MSHQFDSNELLEIYLTSLTKTFDPHSCYLGPKTLRTCSTSSFISRWKGSAPRSDPRTATRSSRRSCPGMAADKDGRLQPEDKIVGIQKENGEEIDLVEKKLSDVVRYIRGPRGTKVRLIVQPEGTKEREDLRADPRADRAQGAARQGQGDRGQGGRRQDTQDRHHQPAGLLRRYRGHPPGRSRTPSARRPIAARSSTTSRKQASRPW